MVLTEDQKNDELVKSLISGGFEEETIAGWIAEGVVKLEKSTQYGPDDHGEGDGDDNHEKRDKKQVEDEKKVKKEVEKEDDVDGDDSDELDKGCDKGKIAKSLGLDTFMKSMETEILKASKEQNEEFAKSLPNIIDDCMNPFLEKMDSFEKSLNGMRTAIEAFGNTAPNFKSANLSKAVIEKSIENGGGVKDEEGKITLSISKDRNTVRNLIIKSIEEEGDETIQKSLRDNTTAWLLDGVEGAIGEPAAMYMYTKKGVRLVK